MTTVSRGEITITNVNDGKTPYFHTAYSWSKDGTDRFTTIYPQDNKLENTQNPSVIKPVQLKGSRTSNTETITMNNGITRQEKQVDKTGEFYYRFMNTADNNLSAVDLTPGKTYHFGLDLRAELAEGDYITWRAQYKTATSSWINMDNWGASFSKIEGVTSEFQRFERELTIPEDATTLYFSYQVYSPNSTSPSVGTVVEFKNAKFALDSASPYTPSPEEDLANAYPTYLGTYSSFEEESSLNPYDYTWSLIKGLDGKDGEDGIPGAPGEDGRTPYFHIGYTNSTDFGNYDFSGNPNLFPNIGYSDISTNWTQAGAAPIKPQDDLVIDNGDSFTVDLSKLTSNFGLYFNNLPRPKTGKNYAWSVELKSEEPLDNNVFFVRPVYVNAGGTLSAYAKPINTGATTGMTRYSATYTNITDVISNSNCQSLQIYFPSTLPRTKVTIKYNIKVEEVETPTSSSTPYQPNIKDAPWHFSTYPLGKNLADKTVKFPINVNTYKVYQGDMLEPFKVGETYTVTIKGRKPAQKTFSAYNAGTVFLGNLAPVEGLSDVWSGTFKVPLINSGYPNRLQIYQLPNDDQYGDVQIDWVKIEKSPVSTPNIDAYKYLGNYADYEQTDSLNPTKYKWNLIKGENGSNGTDSFLHVAWANVDEFPLFVKGARANILRHPENISTPSNNESIYPTYRFWMSDEDGSVFHRVQRRNLDLNPNKFSVYNTIGTVYDPNDPINSGDLTTPIEGKKIVISGKWRASKEIRMTMMAKVVADGVTKALPRDGEVVTVTPEWKTFYTVLDRVAPKTSTIRFLPSTDTNGWDTAEGVYLDQKDLKIEIVEEGESDEPTPWVPPILRKLFNSKNIFEGGNTRNPAAFQGAVVTSTKNVEVPEWGATDASTFIITGGTSVIKGVMKVRLPDPALLSDGETFYRTNFHIRNNHETNDLIIAANGGFSTTIPPKSIGYFGTPSNQHAAKNNLQWHFQVDDVNKDINCTFWNPEFYAYDIAHDFTISSSELKGFKYLGVYTDNKTTNSQNPADYEWNLVKGDTGESAKTLILSTSSNTVKINQDSSIQSDTITLQANMQNMIGTATFSAIPYIGTTPQTAITLGGTGNTRTFSTSSWNKNWTSLVVTATFESFVDKQTIISVKEGKDGTDSITGLLTNESVTLAADKNGAVESFSEASGTFKVFDGLSDVTGKNVAYTLKSSLGGTFNINASTGAYNMTAMSKDSATATFEATYKNIKIEKILNVAKSKAGKETYTYTKYSNSKDFGGYDYSGNPNVSANLNASSFSLGTGATVTDDNGEIVFTLDGTNQLSRYTTNAQTRLIEGKEYTISCEIMLETGFTGDPSGIKLLHAYLPGGITVLQTDTVPKNELNKWQKLIGTRTVTYGSNLPSGCYPLFRDIRNLKPSGKVRLRNIKIEEGSTATPYQPNLLGEPWHLNTVPLGENIANKTIQFPIKSSEYLLYKANMEEEYILGQTYTITLKGTKPASQTFIAYNDGVISFGNLKPVEGLTDVWSLTFTPTKIASNVPKEFRIFQYPSSTIGACQIDWLKIEKGSKRTPNIDSYKYMGIYVGGESEQPHNPTQYAWSQIKGNDSTSYSLLLSSQVMSLPRGASKLVPENITISGMAQTGEKSIENINSRIVVEETTNGTTWTTKYDADALTYTYTPSSLNVLSARVKMYVAGAKNVQLDQKSINIVKDGSNGSNGSSSYTWIRYSENANGNPMTTTPNSKTKYIGIAITQTSTAPSAYGDYTWSRIKGSGGLVAKVYSNGGTNIEQSPIQINVETQSDGDIVEPDKVTWYMSKDSSVEWTAITAGNGITLNKKYIVVEPVVFLEANSISFKAQVEYNSMAAFDYMTVNNKSFDATKPLILRQPAAPLNPYPGLLWLDTSSGSGDPLDKTNPSLVYRWGKSAIESVIGTEYAHYAYANTPTGYQEDGVTPDPDFSVTYNSSQKPMYIGYCVTDTEPDPTTPSSYNWKSITTENGSEDVNGARGIAQEKTETAYKWGWVVLSASDLKMLPWLNNEDGSTIIDWIYQITQKTSDDSIIQTVVGSEDMSKVYAKTDAVDELSSANHELSDKLEEYNKQIEEAFAGIDTTYVNKSEFEQEMNKFNFGIDKAGGVNLIRNSTGFQWEDTAPSDEMLTNPKFEGAISTTGLDNGWVYNATGIGQVIGAESDFPENKIMRIGGTNSPTKYSYSKNVPVSPGQLINISGQVRIPNTIGNTKNAYLSIRFYAAGSDPSFNAASQTIGNGQGVITLFTDKTDFAGTIFETDSYAVKTNNIVQDIWSNYSVNVTIPPGAAFMKVLLYNDSTTPTNYFDFRKPSVVLYSGMFDFWHKNDSANAQIRQILGDESLEELGLIAGFELKGLRYKLDQDILLPNPNTEYTLSWYANKINQSGKSKYYVKVLNTKTGAEIAVSEASADTIGYQRMSVTFSVTNTSAVTIRIGLEGEGSADATLSAAGLMINIGPYPLSWQSHHEEVYSTNVRIDSSGLKVFNSDYDGYNVMTPREFAGYYRNGEVYERVFTLNKDTTKVKKLEAQERFMMRPVQIVSVDSPTIQGWAFVGYNGEDTD